MGGNFNRYLEKATSQLLLEPDWDSVLQIVDSIRMGDVQVKTALLGIKKKIGSENPHVAMFALQLLEACVKNCASTFHSEVATKEFMEFMKDQAKTRPDPVKEKVLELIQTWSHAFRNEPSYKAVEDTFHLLKMEGHKFPTLKEADAMFDAEKAPSWKDAETCTRCRVQFTVVQRKHHCRNCGEIFCKNCSSKTSTIPKLGFERQVRVCDSCYDKLHKTGSSAKKEEDLPAEYLASPLSKQPQNPPSKSEKEQQEEEELQLALALSKSEHESKEKERERNRTNYSLYNKTTNENSAPAPVNATVAPMPLDTSDMDPELARYLNRHYWQQKSEEQTQPSSVSTTVPSAPIATAEPQVSSGPISEAQVVSSHLYQNGDTDSSEAQFLSALQGSLEIFVNRMRSNSQRGRPIANDSAVQSLFAVISDMHPQLMTHIQEKEDDRAHFESLQDKLTQLRDAREALDSLREEHREKRRREAEELDRQRQILMMQKLEVMRQKKHEYLEMQRQHALQRLQEQEREMAARFEQQKQLTHMRQMQAFGFSQGYPPQGVVGQPGMVPPQGQPLGPGMIPQGYTPTVGSAEGSPVHRMSGPGTESTPYGNMAQGMSLPPQAGVYNMAAHSSQYGGMGGGHPGPGSLPPGGYQPEGQGAGVMGQPGFPPMMDQVPMSLPPQQSMAGPMSNTNSGLYTGASGHQFPQQMDGGQPGFGAGPPPQPQDFQPFHMQDMASALPTSQPNVFGNHQSALPPPQQQQFPVGQQQQYQQQPQQYLGPQQQQQQQQPQGFAQNVAQQQAVQQQQQHPPPAPRQPSAVDDLQLISFD
ncbi:hepatocyte growth factor-regulated tyrosine kinase substrate [Elysia marginata]|uniref:Hepatocyte growth factor-regulated tyrosine kinase substrate n=1 Tax=Elysia marginata TaxID=1093978 RepID=A0AAV4H1W6_9GAST|nr:hepatocyte growth factor-regulated tyrosine kinase substrate [Elysia marginata]